MRRILFSLLTLGGRRIASSLLLLPLLAFSATAQNAPAPASAAPVTNITLGQSIVPLTGPWKFHIGDSPQATGSKGPQWANPGFDDSQWETVDLTPKAGSFDPTVGYSGYVTGKGLQAGMLVALIVGAIRTEAKHTSDPMAMLVMLNERLCGRGHAHATCLALRISADGSATLANAGHLPPYLNGKELPMEGAMPLGIIEHAEFSLLEFRLNENDRLMLMSDGVAEAQDEDGKLFGFERIHELLQKPITAAEVATAAQNFGQEDDISVLRIVRDAMTLTQINAEPVRAVG